MHSTVTRPVYHPRNRKGCPNCAKEGKGKECSHCYRHGETSHLKMNCKLHDQEDRMRSRQRTDSDQREIYVSTMYCMLFK